MSTSEESKGCLKMRIIEYHDIKTLLGPCFVSFSIPLLIPGVVLTVVGSYGNENAFPTFGGWHITGIVILSIAVVMLISGIILKCCYRPIISADIEQHLSPTSSMITGSKNLGYEDEIYTSKGLQNSNKVGHHDDLKNSHTVASTHDTKHKKTKDPKNQFLANAAIAENQSRMKPDAARSSLNAQQADAKSTHSSNKTQLPPSYEQVHGKSKQKQERDNVAEANVVEITQGNVTTKVTATIKAEVETAHASGSRNHSSDANENSKFLPAKKKRKKKKRKRHESADSSDVTDGDSTTSRRELPELRMRPALIHEGSEHHHHDLHVHFRNEAEKTKDSADFKNEDDTAEHI